MPNFSENYAPEIVGGVVGSAGHFSGSLFDVLRRSYTFSSQMALGNHHMDQTRDLLQNHLQAIEEIDERDKLTQGYQKWVKGIHIVNFAYY